MKIEQNYLEDHQLELIVETEQDVFDKAKRQAAKKLAKDTKIPGYRPGKAPYRLIVNHFGEGAVVDQALELFLDEIYPQIIDEIDQEPYGPGHVKEIKSLEPPQFVFNVPLQPEVSLGDYRDIRLDYETNQVSDEDVQEILDRMRSQHASVEPVDHPAEEGNLVDTTVNCRPVDSDPDDEEAFVLINQPLPVKIKDSSEENTTEWPFPGFSRQLLGVSEGDHLELTYEFPDDDEVDDDYRGKEMIYSVEVTGIRDQVLPDLTDEFVQSISEQETEAELREEILAELQTQREAEDENAYISRILDAILEDAEVKFPPQMVENEVEGEIKEMEAQLNAQGLDLEMYLKIQNQDEEEFREQIRPTAEERIVRGLVIGKISETEDLDLNPEDITGEYQSILDNHFGEDQAAKQDYMQSGDSVALLNRVSSQIVTRKTLDFLIAVAKGEDFQAYLKTADDEEAQPDPVEGNQEADSTLESEERLDSENADQG